MDVQALLGVPTTRSCVCGDTMHLMYTRIIAGVRCGFYRCFMCKREESTDGSA